MPLALLEKKKHDDTEEKKKKALGNSLPNNWESVFDPLSGKQYHSFLFINLIHFYLFIKFIDSKSRYFFDSMTRRATWTDPRLPQDTYEGKESEGPIIDVLYEIYTSLFVICIRQLKDGWKYWEETFSNICFKKNFFFTELFHTNFFFFFHFSFFIFQVILSDFQKTSIFHQYPLEKNIISECQNIYYLKLKLGQQISNLIIELKNQYIELKKIK